MTTRLWNACGFRKTDQHKYEGKEYWSWYNQDLDLCLSKNDQQTLDQLVIRIAHLYEEKGELNVQKPILKALGLQK